MGLLRLFNAWDFKSLVVHQNSADPYSIPTLFSGESPLTQYMALQVNSAGTAGKSPWGIVDPASYALKLALFRTANSALLAYQDTWANDAAAKTKYAQWLYDSVAVDAALAIEATGVACTLEIEVTPTSGGAFKSYQSAVTLKKGLITPAAATTPANEVNATQGWAKQTFVPRDGTTPQNPCDVIYMKSKPGGFLVAVFPDDNGGLHGERFS